MNQPMLSRCVLAEAFGTFCLVFAGTGAMVVNETTGGGVTHVGVAFTFGLVVMAMVNVPLHSFVAMLRLR